MGRPSKYKEEFEEQAYKLTLLGHTDVELAKYFEVEEKTINNWKEQYPAFLQSIKRGKDLADGDVAASLYKRAIGYSHDDVDIKCFQGDIIITPIVKHYPPDPVAIIFWLTNRQREIWKHKQRDEGGGAPPQAVFTDEQFQQLLLVAKSDAQDNTSK